MGETFVILVLIHKMAGRFLRVGKITKTFLRGWAFCFVPIKIQKRSLKRMKQNKCDGYTAASVTVHLRQACTTVCCGTAVR